MLGILCIYMGGHDSVALARIQLERIRRHTPRGYRIFAAMVRADEELLRLVSEDPAVTVCPCEDTGGRRSNEHSHYLEQLIPVARGYGADRLAILHMDSFPVLDDWVERVFDRVETAGTFATLVDGPGAIGSYTAGLFISPGFLDAHSPRLLVPREQREDPEFLAFAERRRPSEHSGVGYLFTADREGVHWIPLEPTHGDPKGHGTIYDGGIFHVRGALRRERVHSEKRAGTGGRVLAKAVYALTRVVPRSLRKRLQFAAPRLFDRFVLAPRVDGVMGRLLADPDGTVEELFRRPIA